MANKSDLLQGTLDLLVLKTLAAGPMHGWGISLRIQQVSGDVLQVNQGSLYPALHRLEQQGLIEAEWGNSENNRQAKFYQLTKSGRKQLAEETRNWERLADAVASVLAHERPTKETRSCSAESRPALDSLFRRNRLERELDTELRFHIDMLTEQQVRAGMAPAEARRQALGVRVRRAGERRRAGYVDVTARRNLAQDVRYGLRNLRRNPGFALVVILTMALGIGANTAIFSVVNGVLLQPLPYRDGDRLVVLRQQQPLAALDDIGFSVREIEDYRTRSHSLDGIAEFHNMWFILLGRDEPERLATGVVSANFFNALGVQPAYGRDFQEADDKPGARRSSSSDGYWRRSFHADPSVLGRVFKMNDRPHQVIGILPPVTQYPLDVDVYMPTSACPFRSAQKFIDNRDARMMHAFARVKPGITMEKARADLDVVAAGIQAEHPDVYLARDGYRIGDHPSQGGDDARLQNHAARPARHCWIRAADRVRECRQPDPRANGAARTGDRDQVGARRKPAAAAPAAAH